MSMEKKILSDAADLIERTGWTQGALARDENGRICWEYGSDAACFCVLGALRWAGKKQPDEGGSLLFAANDLRCFLRCDDLAQWNDAPERTKEEVVTALRKAAA